MEAPIRFRWLGVGGVELHIGSQTLLIDPYLTRVPLWRIGVGRVRSDGELVAQKTPRCDVVLVTHAHIDHLLDVPAVVRHTGAIALGPSNACRLLAASGVPAAQIREIEAGDRLTLGEFQVEVLPAGHTTIAGWLPFSRPLPRDLRPPLHGRDYRMDRCLGFLIEAGGCRLLHCPGRAAPAEVLTVKPLGTRAHYESLLPGVRPRIVIPVHWDHFGRPLSKPVRPLVVPSGRAIPPFERVDLAQFRRMVRQIVPGTQVLVPEMFRAYDLVDDLSELRVAAGCRN